MEPQNCKRLVCYAGDSRAPRSFLWGSQTTPDWAQYAASDLEANGAKSTGTHGGNENFRIRRAKCTQHTADDIQDIQELQGQTLSSNGQASTHNENPEADNSPLTVVSVEDFGKRDTIRITAAVAGQVEVDDVAKTIRKSGTLALSPNCLPCMGTCRQANLQS